jgi:ABC-type bacteriocin/lantibiotic exporter with double-glycine peptidase domain
MKEHIKNIARLWFILKPFHKYFYIQLGLIIIAQGFVVAIAYGQSTILNLLVLKNIELLIYVFVGYAILYVVDVYVDYLAVKNTMNNLDQTLFQFIQEYSYRKILSLTPAQHIEDHSALKLTVISKGEQAILDIITKLVTTVLPTITLAIIAILTLYIHSPLLAGISSVIIIVIVIWSYMFQKGHHVYVTKNRDQWNEHSRQRTEAFTHLQTIKLLHREDYFLNEYLTKRLHAVKHHLITLGRAATTTQDDTSLQNSQWL